MLELALRLTLIGAALGVSGFAPGADLNTSLSLAAVLALVSVGYSLADKRQFGMDKQATLLACLEIGSISGWLASTGELSRFGVIVLLPMLVAVSRRGVQAPVLAPIAAASLIAADSMVGRLPLTSIALLAPAAIVLIIGVALSIAPKVVTIREIVEKPYRTEPPLTLAGDDYLEIRESYRVLRQRFRELEQQRDQDRFTVRLFALRNRPVEDIFPALAELIANFTGSDGAAILGVAESTQAMIVRGSTTDFPNEFSEQAFPFDPQLGMRDLRLRLDAAVRAVPAAEKRDFGNVLLLDGDRLVGVICVAQSDIEALRICREKADAFAPQIVEFLAEESERGELSGKLAHTEMLYRLAKSSGDREASENIAKLLAQAIQADGVTISTFDGRHLEPISTDGSSQTLADAIRLPSGSGLAAWAKSGYPEIALFDARNDDRCAAEVAIKRRIGSYYQLPLTRGGEVIGILTAATHRAGGIDRVQIETLRMASDEVGRVLSSLIAITGASAVVSPVEFRRLAATKPGCLVMLEVLQREQLELAHSKADIVQALRKFQKTLSDGLREGSAMCRRDSGDYLVFLTNASESDAMSWANEITAGASLTGIPRIDGKGSTPLAVRAKVAPMGLKPVEEPAKLIA